MRPDEVISADPKPEELVQRLEAIPKPAPDLAEKVRIELAAVLGTKAVSDLPPFLRSVAAKVDIRYPEPATSERRWIGPPLVAAKRAFRALGQPFINEILRKQVQFNEEILSALIQVYELLQQHVRAQAEWREQTTKRLVELEDAKRL